jgi:hypothetical protein
MILTPLARNCFIRRLDFGNHANVLNLEAQPIDSRTVSYQRLDGTWLGCDCDRHHEARQDAHIGLCFSGKVQDSDTGILLASNGRGHFDNCFFRADAQVPNRACPP